jgi:hypothetical protein
MRKILAWPTQYIQRIDRMMKATTMENMMPNRVAELRQYHPRQVLDRRREWVSFLASKLNMAIANPGEQK